MQIILDENLPKKLKLDLPEHTVKTVQEMGWGGKNNGELLGLIAFNGFDAFITLDKNLQYQQNIKKFSIAIILLNVVNNKHQTIQPLVPKLKEFLDSHLEYGFIEIS